MDSTPVLNGGPTATRSKSRSQFWKVALMSLVGAVLGGALGFGSAYFLPKAQSSIGELVLEILGVVVLFHLVLAVHEGGHLLGGYLSGFRFWVFIVGPVKIIREGQSIRVGWNTDPVLWGGVAASVPLDDRDLPRRMSLLVAGGPLASLALALLAGGLWYALHVAQSGGLLIFTLGTTAVLSGIIFGLTVIPLPNAGFFTDGARLGMLLADKAKAERWCGLAALSSSIALGQRPRDWNPAWVARSVSLPDGCLDDIGANLSAYYWALDRKEISQAAQFLERAMANREGYPASFRPLLLLETAYFIAMYDQNPGLARQWFDAAKGGMVDQHTRLRAQAAVLLAEGKTEEAMSQALRGLALVDRGTSPGISQAETEWLQTFLGRSSQGALTT
ncbi:hypothetical protein [Anthocerotibacter panamensis]|uniref:hypothetical protein n=1 Tax=Anthocerotibacter panamensis TaxID=2857077 RepID=UPI001C40356C|nr:hypothetical protein [Anthocerotibacter panamensis]